MVKEYTHPDLNEEIDFISGYYMPQREERLAYNGREFLYIAGIWQINKACCGEGGCGYVQVQGYINKWKDKTNSDGKAVSLLEPVTDPQEQKEISEIIKAKEADGYSNQIQFM